MSYSASSAKSAGLPSTATESVLSSAKDLSWRTESLSKCKPAGVFQGERETNMEWRVRSKSRRDLKETQMLFQNLPDICSQHSMNGIPHLTFTGSKKIFWGERGWSETLKKKVTTPKEKKIPFLSPLSKALSLKTCYVTKQRPWDRPTLSKQTNKPTNI